MKVTVSKNNPTNGGSSRYDHEFASKDQAIQIATDEVKAFASLNLDCWQKLHFDDGTKYSIEFERGDEIIGFWY